MKVRNLLHVYDIGIALKYSIKCYTCIRHASLSFIPSFIHTEHLYSASSRELLRGAPELLRGASTLMEGNHFVWSHTCLLVHSTWGSFLKLSADRTHAASKKLRNRLKYISIIGEIETKTFPLPSGVEFRQPTNCLLTLPSRSLTSGWQTVASYMGGDLGGDWGTVLQNLR